MTALFYYILKVVVCSGILYSYYHFALRNKVFHAWNRFYLLAMIPFSILLPLLEMNIIAPADNGTKIVSALRIVAGADEYVLDAETNSGISWSAEMVSLVIYLLVSLTIAAIFTIGLLRLIKMIRKYSPVLLENFYFLNTPEPGTPFSFFRYLVWNQEIPLNTENGQRILEHELVHIREKHSWDKIFIHITLIFFWINPFFWLVRQEMTMVHEFIADRKAIGNGDTEAFAKLILASSFPSHSSFLTQSFFQSSIKRRLAMISKQNNPLVAYVSRLMMIPVVLVMIFAFAVQSEPRFTTYDLPSAKPLGQKYTVMLDAGHGGEDAGAISGNVKEKELSLTLARMVKELNVNPDIELILTRSSDQTTALQDRVKMASDKNAQLFLSLHIASSPSPDQKGMIAFISSRDLTRHEQNVRFASLLLTNLSSIYDVDKKIRQRENQGVWVLDKNVCPAVILECGYLSNKEDRNYISAKANHEKIAKQILRSIEDYFSKTILIQPSTPSVQVSKDTTPKAKTTGNNTKKHDGTIKYFVDGKEVNPAVANSINPDNIASVNVTKGASENTVNIVTKNVDASNKKTVMTVPKSAPPLYILNGTEISEEEMKLIDPNQIESIDVLKDKSAEAIYGEKGKIGVVLITLKKK
jgi:TonB-dependent SusC/RagA subfamily outer membrane receptor